jgi:hypothetical protein
MKERAKGRKLAWVAKPGSFSWLSFCLFKILARFHDEATTSDYGSDIGD